MIYLVDPNQLHSAKCNPRKPLCPPVCSTLCGIKPLYGIDI